jgi:hypothetical protein
MCLDRGASNITAVYPTAWRADEELKVLDEVPT